MICGMALTNYSLDVLLCPACATFGFKRVSCTESEREGFIIPAQEIVDFAGLWKAFVLSDACREPKLHHQPEGKLVASCYLFKILVLQQGPEFKSEFLDAWCTFKFILSWCTFILKLDSIIDEVWDSGYSTIQYVDKCT